MVKNFKMLLVAMGCFVYAQGQDSTKTAAPAPADSAKKKRLLPPVFTITGSIDGYYRFSLPNTPSQAITTTPVLPIR